MKTITIQNLKTNGAKAIPEDQVVYLIVNSKPKAVLLPVDQYEMFVEALEELEDIRDIEARKNEDLIDADQIFPEK
ncbi:type II toxin-antitoxin system Phd/YefM family antitoxin [Candidatus Peregrinibacteria bacterium]|jgi:PHD/YefM family antitoxin component YafN of YafNO toxin-antitoxin module|nr:type II toxin-antitoxin system Phd/YefM family antitoxin [Candidatus Peregrinibacteria bacterium]MBT3599212.1 type II toxin-antitoxin system Phd/YefM family antitoxin [Candidatus Peregrinibacteria bacterium]MBT4367465.1 type II toxin-antitoxin system Phd/YefM family antitoxin [Candidatus Peregrinibacteria bacterium]MBT4585585.1 type II toxin-antitoxin system Phd/YefM family antitoxin [Candidatus Peregrinibacteria bacterium]MBT6731013.1 type II toxin-antitoxin system Phd/YefM family antitoxin